MTFDDISNLTAGQRTKLEQFRQVGLALNTSGPPPDISGLTDAQAKSAAQYLQQETKALLDPTENGVRYVREHFRRIANKAYEDSVIPGP